MEIVYSKEKKLLLIRLYLLSFYTVYEMAFYSRQ